MESIVKDLLEELYIIEPNLRKQEKKLENIVSLMVKHIPKSEMNTEFKKELRKEILMKIHAKKNKYYTLYLPMLSWLSLCGVLIFVGINISNSILIPGKMLSLAPSIEQVGPNAFGNTIKTIWGQQMEYTPKIWSQMMRVWKIAWEDQIMAINNPIQYIYSYTGKLDIPTNELVVYRRDSVGFKTTDTSDFINNLRVDGLDTQALENAGISNINISEDREFGYNIGIDFTQGTVSYNQNYIRWPQVKCDTNGCAELAKLTEKDIPTDDSMIRIADEFIRRYKIDTKLYGSPVVNSEWRTHYMRQKQEWNDIYIPDSYTVTYPVKIDGKFIYEEYGEYKWLVLTIDIRNNKISNVTGLEKYNLISSEYNTLNSSTIEKMVKSGGRYVSTDTGTDKVVSLNLSTPTLWYVRIYGEWKDGVSSDFLVPAYVFKVIDKPSDVYRSDTVIIPLVEWFAEIMPPPNVHPTEPIMMR
jgi:hypothetical protein